MVIILNLYSHSFITHLIEGTDPFSFAPFLTSVISLLSFVEQFLFLFDEGNNFVNSGKHESISEVLTTRPKHFPQAF